MTGVFASIGRKFRSYDKFSVGKPALKINFEGAGGAYMSYMGAFVSIVFIVISSIFLYSKILIMYNVSQVTIISNEVEGAFTQEDEFTAGQGFFVAAALTEYDSNTEPIEDPTYGTLDVIHNIWDVKDDGTVLWAQPILETHACSERELGLLADQEQAENKNSVGAFKIFETSYNEVRVWQKKFKCLDEN